MRPLSGLARFGKIAGIGIKPRKYHPVPMVGRIVFRQFGIKAHHAGNRLLPLFLLAQHLRRMRADPSGDFHLLPHFQRRHFNLPDLLGFLPAGNVAVVDQLKIADTLRGLEELFGRIDQRLQSAGIVRIAPGQFAGEGGLIVRRLLLRRFQLRGQPQVAGTGVANLPFQRADPLAAGFGTRPQPAHLGIHLFFIGILRCCRLKTVGRNQIIEPCRTIGRCMCRHRSGQEAETQHQRRNQSLLAKWQCYAKFTQICPPIRLADKQRSI